MCIFNKKRVNSTSEVKNMDKISVVVPCYNEEEALPVYYKEMCRVMDEIKDVVFELIFVDDGSSDATPQNDEKDFERLEKWAVKTKYKRVAKKKIEPKKLILHRAERVMSIRKAAFSPYRKIKVSDAGGSICASQTIACPPAIPIAVCGERIDQNMISIFEEYGIDYVNVVSY